MSAIPQLEFVGPEVIRLDRETLERRPGSRAGFALFLCVNAALFIRPSEILEDLKDLPLYEVLIILCLLTSLPSVARVLRWPFLAANPHVLCILALLPAVVLSNLAHNNLWLVRTGGLEFAKLLVYFVLLVGLVDSPARLRTFLVAITILVLAMAAICVLQYHEIINLNLDVTYAGSFGTDPDTGDLVPLLRLQATGLFSDPNDFSLVLAAAMLIGTHVLLEPKRLLARLLWLPPIALLGYAFALTRSRGGFLALLGGAAVLMVCRLGWRKSLPWAVILLPLVFMAFGGRQTSIDLDNTDDTAQSRFLLWRDSLVLFKSSPIFGIGFNQLQEVNGMVAHNSYVHAYTELGIVGGTAFVGAWYLLGSAFCHMRPRAARPAMDELDRWHGCLMAVFVGYGVGLLSLTRLSALPTYLVLGIACVACALRGTDLPGAVRPLSTRLFGKIVLVSLSCLVLLDVAVRVLAR